MRITFDNAPTEGKEHDEFLKRAKRSLHNTEDDMSFYMNFGTDTDDWEYNFKDTYLEHMDEIKDYFFKYPKTAHFHIARETSMSYLEIADAKEFIESCDSISPFYEYGLGFDFVEAGTFSDQQNGYYRFQISWGGPSSEIRFHFGGQIEYVFLDWFTGIGFDISHYNWAKWLYDWFKECESINWDSKSYEELTTEQ